MNQDKMTRTKDEVLALYVNDFKSNQEHDDLGGHLMVGRVYLCVRHEELDGQKRVMYRIYFDDNREEVSLDGIFIRSLKETNASRIVTGKLYLP